MREYIRLGLWDVLLCTLTSLGLACHIYAGFHLEGTAADVPPLAALFLGGVTFLLFLGSYSRRTMLFETAGVILLLAGFLAYAGVTGALIEEEANRQGVFALVTFLSAALVFLLARSRAGTFALFLLGTLVCCGSAFLQFPVERWAFLCFAASAALLILYRVYRTGLLRASAGKVRIGRYLVQSVCFCLGACLLAGAVFVLVIKPLSPPTRELKLVTRLETMDWLHVLGVATTRKILDPELASKKTQEETLYGSLAGEEEGEAYEEEDTASGMEEASTEESDPEERAAKEETAGAVDYPEEEEFNLFGWAILLLLFLVILWLPVGMHRAWFRRVKALDPESGVVNLYSFFLRCLKKTGRGRPVGTTLLEYAAAMEEELSEYAVGSADFAALTAVYTGVFYGGKTVTEEEYRMFLSFYQEFFKNLRRDMGVWSYALCYYSLLETGGVM